MKFENKVLVKGVERKKSAKGKDYSIVILEDEETGRTVDFYHDGIISIESDKVHTIIFDYSIRYGSGQMQIVGLK